jgi:ribosomal protein S18 acetylase RimI-like enzyme
VPPLLIRPLTATDAPRYRDIRLEGLKLNPEAFSSTFAHENALGLDWFAERITRGNIFGGFLGDDLVGVADYRPQEGTKVRHKAGFWGMYVSARARNLGLGQRLIEAIVDHATGRVEQLQLSVASDNEAAIRLYRKMGFAEYGREMKALKQDGRYSDETLMVRFLVRDPGRD